jgi:integrase/recombinase XerD
MGMGVRPGARQGIAVRGPLETHAAGLAAHLAELGYQRGPVQRHLRMMGRLGQWMEERGLVPGELTDEAAALFAEMMRAAGSSRMSVCGLASALSFLRGQGVVPAVAPRWSGHAELLEDYRVHLARERGLAAGTVENKLRVAREFPDEAGDGAGELRELTAARMLEILTLLARRRAGYGSAVTTASFARTLLRFLFATGRVAADLAPAIPRVSSAGASGSARGRLPPGTVARLLQGCDRSREAGLRGYAVLLLLARPGLRAGEIAAIDFGDIGWADGTLLVHGKGGRSDILPLPADARYLCSRPAVPGCRAVFITARVPRHAIGRGTVAGRLRLRPGARRPAWPAPAPARPGQRPACRWRPPRRDRRCPAAR